MLTGLFGIAILIARLFPTTPTGRWLHLMLVETPLARASRIERSHIIFALILIFAGHSLLMAAPLELALIYAFDLSVYLDAVVAVGALSVANRAKLAWVTLKAAAVRALSSRKLPVGRAARPRKIRARVRKVAANRNDKDRPAFVRHAA